MMAGMAGSDGELDQVRQVLDEARRALEAVGKHAADGHSHSSLPLLIHHLHEVLQAAEGLLTRQEQYESRLHRTPHPRVERPPRSPLAARDGRSHV
jgi:hypothetical protein